MTDDSTSLSLLSEALSDKCKAVRKLRDAQIPEEYIIALEEIPSNPSKLYKKAGPITELDATALADKIRSKDLTALEVIRVFIQAACYAHAATNCLAWLDVRGAEERARWLDEEQNRTGKTVGPLHGVPISVKDFIEVQGIPQSSGDIKSAGYTPNQDAELIAILKHAGAAKTTQPQGIMHLETSSFLYGTTTNAYNRALTSGGSSGGEGALVGCRGSPLGVTTDIGGSTRGPAACNGLWGFKPSTKRIPRKGFIGITTISQISGTVGPVAHSLRDLELWFKVVIGSKPCLKDIKLVNTPWRDVTVDGKGLGFEGWSGKEGKLRVGIMRDNGVVRPVKAIRRALEGVVNALEGSGGVEVVDVEPIGFEEAWGITPRLYYVDGGKKLGDQLGEEPMLPLTKWLVDQAEESSREDVYALVQRRNDLRQAFYDHYQKYNIDVLLLPAGPAPAQPVGTTKYWPYLSMWNLLDWPAAVFPTGLHVEEADEEKMEPRNNDEKHLYDTCEACLIARSFMTDCLDSAKVAVGSPLCLQVVAPRWQDERLMAALHTINKILPLE